MGKNKTKLATYSLGRCNLIKEMTDKESVVEGIFVLQCTPQRWHYHRSIEKNLMWLLFMPMDPGETNTKTNYKVRTLPDTSLVWKKPLTRTPRNANGTEMPDINCI